MSKDPPARDAGGDPDGRDASAPDGTGGGDAGGAKAPGGGDDRAGAGGGAAGAAGDKTGAGDEGPDAVGDDRAGAGGGAAGAAGDKTGAGDEGPDAVGDDRAGAVGGAAGEPAAGGPAADAPGNAADSGPARRSSGKLVAGLVVAIAAAAFFAGYTAGALDDSGGMSDEQLQAILSAIDSKMTAPSAAPDEHGSAGTVRVSVDDDPMKGDPDAGLTIVEFSDFQCPFCFRFYDQTLPLIEREYIDTGKVNLVYRDFPLQNHQNAVPTHIAAECADEQGAFWPYHDVLFETQDSWKSMSPGAISEQLVRFADGLGLRTADFESCLGSAAPAQEIQKDYQDGVQYGVRGTPAFFIGNERDGYVLLSGAQPFESFQRVIESRIG